MTTYVAASTPRRGVGSVSRLPRRALLSVCAERAGGIAVLDIDGEIDLRTADTLRSAVNEELTHPTPSALVLKLSAVTFCSCVGLAILFQTAQRAAQAAIPLRLVCPDRAVLRPLCLTGLADQFQLRPTLSRALEDLPTVG
jgi:anti-sigma B factor antagonist